MQWFVHQLYEIVIVVYSYKLKNSRFNFKVLLKYGFVKCLRFILVYLIFHGAYPMPLLHKRTMCLMNYNVGLQLNESVEGRRFECRQKGEVL